MATGARKLGRTIREHQRREDDERNSLVVTATTIDDGRRPATSSEGQRGTGRRRQRRSGDLWRRKTSGRASPWRCDAEEGDYDVQQPQSRWQGSAGGGVDRIHVDEGLPAVTAKRNRWPGFFSSLRIQRQRRRLKETTISPPPRGEIG